MDLGLVSGGQVSRIARGLEQYSAGVSGLVKVTLDCTVAVEYVEHHTFNTHIPSISCLHLPTFMPHAAIVSENSTILLFP